LLAAYEGAGTSNDLSPSLIIGNDRAAFTIPRIGDHPIWGEIDLDSVPSDHWMVAIKAFIGDPTPATLQVAVIATEAAGAEPFWGSYFLPWPVAAVLQDLLEGAISHEFLGDPSFVGDQDSWRRIEASWQKPVHWGDLADSFVASIRDGVPFVPITASTGRSYEPLAHGRSRSKQSEYLGEILRHLSTRPSSCIRAQVAQIVISSLRGHDKNEFGEDEVVVLKSITEIALEGPGPVDLLWLGRIKSHVKGLGPWLDRVLRNRAGQIWMPQVPPQVFQEWVTDFSQVELGLALCDVDPSSIPKGARNAIFREWRRIKNDSSIDARHRCAVCLMASSLESCKDEKDVKSRVEVLAAAVKAGLLRPNIVVIQLHLSHESIQQKFLLGFLDALPGVDYEVAEIAMDRLVADATSLQMEVNFGAMRAR
jgi:hypothetical protein